MERICPFLALADDARTVVGGYDADHRCGAVDPPDELDRAQQVGVCLDTAFRRCPRFLAALEGRVPTAATVPRPAPDAVYAHTRLILAPDGRDGHRLRTRATAIGPAARRWAVGGTLATVGLAAVASGVAGGLGSLGDTLNATPAPSGSTPQQASPSPTPILLASPPATPLPSAAPASTPPTPAPTAAVTPIPSVAAQTRTYVVQPGDTLVRIADRFGVTVAAIQAANGISDDVITVGQVLVIP